MTTTVIVQAHCDPKKTQVRVDIRGDEKPVFLQDGEEDSFTVHGDRRVTVREVPQAVAHEED